MFKRKLSPMNYWIFCCNPRDFDLNGRLAVADANPETTWQAKQYWRITRRRKEMIQAEDIAFIWENGRKPEFGHAFGSNQRRMIWMSPSSSGATTYTPLF